MINILTSKVFNRIAAGEVVEKPASAIKELIENSIDAKASSIVVEIVGGGIKKMAITDNGTGISKEDVEKAFLPHATSKILDILDLDKIMTLGFRGEALASIASVSNITMITKTLDSLSGTKIELSGGEIRNQCDVATKTGTYISVDDLFFNTPARAKFLRKTKTEEAEITHVVERLMLAHPEISFRYVVDGDERYSTMGSGIMDVIYTIYGKEVHDSLLEVYAGEGGYKVSGFVTLPKVARANRTMQTLFVNGRFVENYMISNAVSSVYESFLMKGKFPIFIINIIVPFDEVDVNVHPSKREVKFQKSGLIYSLVSSATERALMSANHVVNVKENEVQTFKIDIDKLEKLTDNNGVSFKEHMLDKITIDEVLIDLKEDRREVVEEVFKAKELDSSIPDFRNISSKDDNPSLTHGMIFFDQEETLLNRHGKIESKKDDSFKEEVIEESKMFSALKVIGTAFSTYIFIEKNDEIFVIDQHAAHERQLYDKLRIEIDKNNLSVIDLLVPYAFTVSYKDMETLDNNLEVLENLGFSISQYASSAYRISSVPYVLSGINLKNFVDGILAELSFFKKNASDIIKDKLASMACKSAVKGGDKLSEKEIEILIEKLNDGVMLCPHGRPIVIKFSRHDLEKWFKRIV